MPVGLIVHPMADEAHGREVPLINLGSAGIIRCRKCRTYMNPFVQWTDSGRRWGEGGGGRVGTRDRRGGGGRGGEGTVDRGWGLQFSLDRAAGDGCMGGKCSVGGGGAREDPAALLQMRPPGQLRNTLTLLYFHSLGSAATCAAC